MMRNFDPPEESLTWWLGEASSVTSTLGSSRTMVARRLTGSVTEPVSFTSALILQRMPKVQIGRGQGNLVLLRFDQDVAQDGHRGFGPDDVEHLLQAVAEMVAVDFEFHEGRDGWTER